MLRTGWDRAQLGRQPAPDVRRLFWRLFAERAWDRLLVDAVRVPLPAGPMTEETFRARIAKEEAVKALATLEGLLFPADDDGGQ